MLESTSRAVVDGLAVMQTMERLEGSHFIVGGGCGRGGGGVGRGWGD